MLSPRWRKVVRDLWNNKSRTVLVVISIAVGVFAVGLIAGTQAILSTDMPAAYAAVNPASAIVFTDPLTPTCCRPCAGWMGLPRRKEGGVSPCAFR